ncbi:probable receptor-like protein kinase At1g30570 [Aristolochia californica]|uniref:probable receptor-like protein kinase At1g30570 n=1 Tax=Aristolochia californica TaxID=171875 RepID=UPI0035E30C3A
MGSYWLIVMALSLLYIDLGEAQMNPVLINCGANSSVVVDGRTWYGDLSFQNLTVSFPGSVASTASANGNLMYGDLYKTARIFNQTSNYTFKVVSGSYYLRLHFYQFPLENSDVNDSLFDVTANNLKLLTQFSVTNEISHKNSYLQSVESNSTLSSLRKEYFIDVGMDGILVKFVPNEGSFAFVNAIEIIPVLDKLFLDSINKVGGSGGNFSLSDKGIETMYRLNVGTSKVEPAQDQDLWRIWENDYPYMFTVAASEVLSNKSNISYASNEKPLVAPLFVYEDARTMINAEVSEKRINISWKFEVHPNFDYLVRLHFCELFYDKPGQRIFRIYVNNQTAADNVDVFMKAGGKDKAFHKDYIDSVLQNADTLWVQLGPDITAGDSGTDALLNGLEIFKISRNGNLAHVSGRFDPGDKHSSGKKGILWGVICGAVVLVGIFCALCVFFCCKQKKKAAQINNHPTGWRPLFLHATLGSTTDARSKFPHSTNGSMATTRLGRRFTIVEILISTKNFDESLVIGTGGFGQVYKGEIEDGTLVAIKRAHPQSEQGLREFETEIEMLSKLRHRHLVSMIGYCDEQSEMILVYEYMANGTLRSHLFGSNLPALSWKQRLDVCIGAARGLHYLHTGAEGGIIHRDVKTTNILLDENFVAKVADFGLSKTGPTLDQTHVSTAVKGSFGYLDPEYFRRQQLTEKSDVYSFGVVLFEVVCARPVINPSLPKNQINLAEWAIRWQKQGSLETIVDPQLEGSCSLESLKKFGEIAEKCLADEGKNRPTMGEVLWHLEYVLQLHEANARCDSGGSFTRSKNAFFPVQNAGIEENRSSFGEEDCIMSKGEEGKSDTMERIRSEDTMRRVDFSQLVHPQGR